jgi:heme-degrading monooxygenase HmoA
MEVLVSDRVYTLGVWRVKPGREAEFIGAWKDLGTLFAQLPMPPGGKGTLVQSLSDPLLFYSFGEWSSMDAIQAMRQDAAAQAGIRKVAELCTEATPGTFRVVAEV